MKILTISLLLAIVLNILFVRLFARGLFKFVWHEFTRPWIRRNTYKFRLWWAVRADDLGGLLLIAVVIGLMWVGFIISCK